MRFRPPEGGAIVNAFLLLVDAGLIRGLHHSVDFASGRVSLEVIGRFYLDDFMAALKLQEPDDA